jgi:hypothetical protein
MAVIKPLPFDVDYVNKLFYIESPDINKLNTQSGLKNKITRANNAKQDEWTGSISKRSDGRCVWGVVIDKKRFLASRVIYLLAYGEDPYPHQIDHIDRNSLNNTVSNLRKDTVGLTQKNQGLRKNNTSGVKGVHWNSKRSKWIAQITIEGTPKNLGYYETIQEAAAARNKAVIDLWPEEAYEPNIVELNSFASSLP